MHAAIDENETHISPTLERIFVRVKAKLVKDGKKVKIQLSSPILN